MTVAAFPAPIERALRVRSDGLVEVDDVSYLSVRSQDLVPAYHDLGQMYWGTVRAWNTDVPVAAARTRAFVMESWRAVDIDTPEDWYAPNGSSSHKPMTEPRVVVRVDAGMGIGHGHLVRSLAVVRVLTSRRPGRCGDRAHGDPPR